MQILSCLWTDDTQDTVGEQELFLRLIILYSAKRLMLMECLVSPMLHKGSRPFPIMLLITLAITLPSLVPCGTVQL